MSKQGWTLLRAGMGLRTCLLADTLNSALSQPLIILPALLRAKLMLWSDLCCLQVGSPRGTSSAHKRDPVMPMCGTKGLPAATGAQRGVMLSGAYMNR